MLTLKNKTPNNKNIKNRDKNQMYYSFWQRNSMTLEVFRLIFKSYRRQFNFFFFGFVQPIILLVVFYFLFTSLIKGPTGQPYPPTDILAGYFLLAPISSSLFAFSSMLSIWKDSILLKRIDITPITKLRLFLTFITFFFCVSLLSAFWTIAWSALFILMRTVKITSPAGTVASYTVPYVFGQIKWGWLFISLFEIIIIANCIAIFSAGIVRGVNTTEAVVMSFYFPSAFLGGIVFPNRLIDHYKGLKWFSYFLPFKFPAYIANHAWGTTISSSYLNSHPGILIVVGLAWPIILLPLAMLTFRWE